MESHTSLDNNPSGSGIFITGIWLLPTAHNHVAPFGLTPLSLDEFHEFFELPPHIDVIVTPLGLRVSCLQTQDRDASGACVFVRAVGNEL